MRHPLCFNTVANVVETISQKNRHLQIEQLVHLLRQKVDLAQAPSFRCPDGFLSALERPPFRGRAESFPWSATLLSAPGCPLCLESKRSLARLFKLFGRFSISADIFSRPFS